MTLQNLQNLYAKASGICCICLLIVFYAVTRLLNHNENYDSRLGEEKFAATENLAALLMKNAELVNANKFGKTYKFD